MEPPRYQQRMTTTIQIYGRLGRAPEQRSTAAGKAMVNGAMVVDLRRDGEMPEWFSLVAFGTIDEALARHAKGDMVAVSGRLTKSAWTGRDGAERSGFSVLVDSIASARTVVRRVAQDRAGAREIAFVKIGCCWIIQLPFQLLRLGVDHRRRHRQLPLRCAAA